MSSRRKPARTRGERKGVLAARPSQTSRSNAPYEAAMNKEKHTASDNRRQLVELRIREEIIKPRKLIRPDVGVERYTRFVWVRIAAGRYQPFRCSGPAGYGSVLEMAPI